MSQFEENKRRMFKEKLKELKTGWEEIHKCKLTQEKLANAVYVTRETVSGWYNGKSYPPEETQKRICDFFKVPDRYFTRYNYDNGMTEIDERTHENLEENCEETAHDIGLSLPFISFLKENPAISDEIVSACWVDAYMQSFSPSVPLMEDKTFQFVSSSNTKVYPSPEVLHMLRVVQRDLSEYALFLIQKWVKVIKEAHEQEKGKEMSMGPYGWRTENGDEFTTAASRFALEMKGRGSLTTGASYLVDLYNGMTGNDQEQLLSHARKALHESRKNNPKVQKVRKAIREAMNTHTPVPPIEEIMKSSDAEQKETQD